MNGNVGNIFFTSEEATVDNRVTSGSFGVHRYELSSVYRQRGNNKQSRAINSGTHEMISKKMISSIFIKSCKEIKNMESLANLRCLQGRSAKLII